MDLGQSLALFEGSVEKFFYLLLRSFQNYFFLQSRYSIQNLIIDADRLPPYLPERRGYVSLKFTGKDNGVMKDLSALVIFFEVENIGISRFKNVTKKKRN